MTDENQNVAPEVNVTAEVSNTETPAVEKVEIETPTQAEKLLSQDEVNRIVGSAKVAAHERGKREGMATVSKEAPTQTTAPADQEAMRQMIQQEADERAAKQYANQVAHQFTTKVTSGAKKYSDYNEVVGKLNIPNLPGHIIDWANSVDNTADLMYEFGKNPTKFGSVMALAATSPELAYSEFVKLSDSIKKNQAAAAESAQTNVNEPLDQLKPSNVGTDDGKISSVEDFKKQSWLRG